MHWSFQLDSIYTSWEKKHKCKLLYMVQNGERISHVPQIMSSMYTLNNYWPLHTFLSQQLKIFKINLNSFKGTIFYKLQHCVCALNILQQNVQDMDFYIWKMCTIVHKMNGGRTSPQHKTKQANQKWSLCFFICFQPTIWLLNWNSKIYRPERQGLAVDLSTGRNEALPPPIRSYLHLLHSGAFCASLPRALCLRNALWNYSFYFSPSVNVLRDSGREGRGGRKGEPG